jgi:large subunit ribosomal protein L25
MKTVSMSGSLRENVGKKDAKKHRNEGKVPCVLYGGSKQIHFTIEEKPFSGIIFTPEVYIIKIIVDGSEYSAVLQDVQYHPVTDKILHADFLEVLPGKPVTIAIPVKIEGSAPGVLKGGKLHKKIRKLKVKAMVEDLPDSIVISIDNLEIGDSVRVRDISYKNLEFLDVPASEVVGVKTARGADTAPEGEEEAAKEATEEKKETTE